jgi:environmental stress-induced protein Ves
MLVIPASDYRRMRWKNGGGETAEIRVFPQDSGLDDFMWRISSATIERDGPFSQFRDVDRTLAILEGKGLMLDIEGRGEIHLTADSLPFSFPADTPVHARLVDGPVVDLNVMTRRSVPGRVLMHSLASPLQISLGVGVNLLFSRSGEVRVTAGRLQASIGTGDTLIIDTYARRARIEPREKSAEVFHIVIGLP